MSLKIISTILVGILLVCNNSLIKGAETVALSSNQIPPFSASDYEANIFGISECNFSHGAVRIRIIQVKRNADFSKSPHACRAWIEVIKGNQVTWQSYYDDIDPVGYSFGLFVPKEKPSPRYFAVLKHGDYDGRLFLIDKQGTVIDLPGGLYFVTSDKRHLFSQYASDASSLSVFDLHLGKEICRINSIPFVHQWYKKGRKYFFTESEWLTQSGLPSEKQDAVYAFDFASKTLTKEKIVPSYLLDASELSFDFDPVEYPDCNCNSD